MRGGLHGIRQQRARCAGPRLSRTRSAAARRDCTHHPFRLGVLDVAAGASWLRIPPRGVLRTGARDGHRRLCRLCAGRSRNADHRAADGDASLGPATAPVSAARRRTGRAGGHAHRRRVAARTRDGRCALGGAGRRTRGVAGLLRRHRSGACERSGGVHRYTRTVLCGTAVARRRCCDSARLGGRTRAGGRSRARTGGAVRRSGG